MPAASREAGQGKSAEQQEVNAAVGRFTLYIIPLFVLIFGLNFPAALPLYWLVSSSVAYLQQWWILREDEEEMEAIVDSKKGGSTTKSGLKVTRRTVGQDEVAAKTLKAKKKSKTKAKAPKGRKRK
jgi:YidC/Oxa1 family membrane protein insertase